jgi:hypothetical protein
VLEVRIETHSQGEHDPKRDLFGILGIPTEAAPSDKRAYRRIAFSVHPDAPNCWAGDSISQPKSFYRSLESFLASFAASI